MLEFSFNAVTVFFTAVTALYCAMFFNKGIRPFYKWLIVFLLFNAVLQTVDWLLYVMQKSFTDYNLIFSFMIQTSILGLTVILADSVQLKKLSSILLSTLVVISMMMALTVVALSRPLLYFTVSFACVITFILLVYSSFPIILQPNTRATEFHQLGRFWCIVAFTLLIAGNLSDYSLHYLIAMKHRYDFIGLHQYVSNIPLIFANFAILLSFRTETIYAR